MRAHIDLANRIVLTFQDHDYFEWFDINNKTWGIPKSGTKVIITKKELLLAENFDDYIQGSVYSPAYERYKKALDDFEKGQGEVQITHLQNLIDLGTYLYKTHQCFSVLRGMNEEIGYLGLPYHRWMA